MKHTSFTNIGSRNKNEDAFYESESLFIVCDGVGGNVYGEVASKLACSSLGDYFSQNPATVYNNEYLSKALNYTILKFQETENKYPETKGMSTTVALIVFDKVGANIAWLGDSRVYHIRNGRVLFVTEDHSLINELAKKGEDVSGIKKNIITKSLHAKAESEFSLHRLNNASVQQGDFFFLCTDGVLENITEERLCAELAIANTLEEKEHKIFTLCDGRTRDNFTFQIIEL